MANAQQTFIDLTGGLDYPMLVATASGPEGPAGCLVGFSTQCSIDPPRYLVCLSDKNRTQRVATTAATLGVHFLDSDATEMARLFGEETTDQSDSFSRCRWHEGPGGAPVLEDCGRWFVGTILERHVLGDHVGYLLEPVAAANEQRPVAALYFHEVKNLQPGHEA